MQLLSALIILTAMDMEVVIKKMVSVIVIATGVVNLTVQVTYQANLLIYGIRECSMTMWTKGNR